MLLASFVSDHTHQQSTGLSLTICGGLGWPAPILVSLLVINRQFDVELRTSNITRRHAMGLYGDLHVELEMSILDRSYGVLKRSIKLSIFCRVTVDLYVGVDHRWCRCGVDMVSMVPMVSICKSIIMSSTLVGRVCGLNLQLKGRVQVYISWAWPLVITLCSLVICLSLHLVTSPIQECTAKRCTNWTLVWYQVLVRLRLLSCCIVSWLS
jgi:hypothetical protein